MISYDVQERILTVSLFGEIDHHTSAGIRSEIDGLVRKYSPLCLILDFAGVDFCDSSGIAVVLALPGYANASYAQVQQLAEKILEGVGDRDIYVCLEADMAKALGQSLCLQQQKLGPCLCIDRVRLSPQSYLDVGTPVGPALPVVVKTLVLEAQE